MRTQTIPLSGGTNTNTRVDVHHTDEGDYASLIVPGDWDEVVVIYSEGYSNGAVPALLDLAAQLRAMADEIEGAARRAEESKP